MQSEQKVSNCSNPAPGQLICACVVVVTFPVVLDMNFFSIEMGFPTPIFQSITITSTRWQRQRSDVICGPRGRNCCFYVMIRFYLYTFIRHIGILHNALNRTVSLRHEQPVTIENTCMTNKVNTIVRVGRILLADPVGSEPSVFVWRPFPDGMGVVFWLETWK